MDDYKFLLGLLVVGVLGGAGYKFFERSHANNRDGLSVVDLYATAVSSGLTNVHVEIANTSARSGDVVFWVRVNGQNFCPNVMYMAAKAKRNIAFQCGSIPANTDFNFALYWPDGLKNMVAVADRLN